MSLPIDAEYPIRALVRGGSGLPEEFQGKVFQWREKSRTANGGRRGYKMLPFLLKGANSMGERPFSYFANPVDILIDPTQEQIEAEAAIAKAWNR
jgi:hypothetical protein